MKKAWIVLLVAVALSLVGFTAAAKAESNISTTKEMEMQAGEEEGTETAQMKDPLEPFNRAMFVFNDTAYHYVLKPLHTGYSVVVPEVARTSIGNFFTNIRVPGRFFNCLFQGKFKNAGIEIGRFAINSTIGFAGFFDTATKLGIKKNPARDFGQTLAKGKIGRGPYLVLPLIGPSNPRDFVGFVGDTALDPLSFICPRFSTLPENVGTYAGEIVNDGSDKGKTYESITEPAIDSYIALRQAYTENREKKMKE